MEETNNKKEVKKDNQSIKDIVLNRILDIFFNKTKFTIFLLFIFGFILRIIAAINLGVSADDVSHSLWPINIFNSLKLVNWGQSTILWYYIQGVFYKIFGISMLSSRFAAVLFGSLTIILMYLLVKKIFKSEKAAVISSLFIAISPILIKNSLPEMDIALSFFALLSAYFLIEYFESKKKLDLILSSIFIGIGTMIKLYGLFFAFSFIIFLIYKEVKNKTNKKKIVRTVILFGLIVFILATPTIAHNYLLYKDKGFMDLIFTNTFKLGAEKAKEYYSWGAGWMSYSDYKGFFLGNQKNFSPTPIPGAILVLNEQFMGDPLLSIFGFLGLILSFKKNRNYFWFFIITFLPAFIYLGAQIPMSKHFLWILVFIAPCAGNFVKEILEKLPKMKLKHIFTLFIIFNLFYLSMPENLVGNGPFYAQSSFGQLVTYKEKIPLNALVIADSRIYRGNIHWGLAGTNYIEASQFVDLANQLNSQQSGVIPIDTYYVECAIDDCGWGTIKNQPEFNQSMEEITSFFKNISTYQEDFLEPYETKIYLPIIGEKRVVYRVYKTQLSINPMILSSVKQTHVWFFYPIGYNRVISPIFDDYTVRNFPDRLLNSLAFKILYFEIFISFLVMVYLIYLFIIEGSDETINNNPSI